ncbi:Hypothetical predicted protein [Xyrichtys novacula]|uniref:Uncharacterized protein n=1 Tax=Xyrichtys novacula TaxID=13765 RepID=A0AAV1H3L8_XYRNO|nr:Hypothetical predicted protein [Xyrichtys novacula]
MISSKENKKQREADSEGRENAATLSSADQSPSLPSSQENKLQQLTINRICDEQAESAAGGQTEGERGGDSERMEG